jgi:hypothetical protein
MTLEFTQSLTEMSTKNFSWGKERLERKGNNHLTAIDWLTV